MKQIIIALLVLSGMGLPAYAISKEEFLKLSYKERHKFPVIAGTYSPEYAIPREEFVKLPFAVRSAINREIARESCQYAIQHFGKKLKDLDVSKLFDLSMSGDVSHYAEDVIDYSGLARFCENHFKVGEYYYKDYLEWKKWKQGQPSLWTSPKGDNHPLSCMSFDLFVDFVPKPLDTFPAASA